MLFLLQLELKSRESSDHAHILATSYFFPFTCLFLLLEGSRWVLTQVVSLVTTSEGYSCGLLIEVGGLLIVWWLLLLLSTDSKGDHRL